MSLNNFQPTSVNPTGLTSLIRNLGRDCLPTQYIREFTKNAIEACQRTGTPNREVVIDFNIDLFRSHKLYKMCFVDNGDGMTPDQMLSLLNNLSASGITPNQHENYGVGAKISALTRNHEGIVYESWKDGDGHTIVIKYNEQEDVYGIQGFVGTDDNTVYAPKLKIDHKPSIVRNSGTRVTLLGMSFDDDTMSVPAGLGGIRESWIVLYLNTRFFTIPDGIKISARIGYYRDPNNTRHNYLSEITGQRRILDKECEVSGTLQVSDASVHWWILPKGADGHGRSLLKGHTALVNQGEIFDISDARSNRIAHFGVIVGRDRIVLYVEPNEAVQNTARTGLKKPDGSDLNWDKWQDEFRERMPDKIKAFLKEILDENAKDSNTDTIRERLKSLKDLYKISRYQPVKGGQLLGDPNSSSEYSTANNRIGEVRERSPIDSSRGTVPGSLATRLLSDLVENAQIGTPAREVEPDPFPKVEWTNEAENEHLIDRAAEYISSSNVIVANRDFKGFRDVATYFTKHFEDSEFKGLIDTHVYEAFEQLLMECVAGALSLRNRPRWNPSDFQAATSKEALTTVVMQRYWMVSHVKRVLGAKIKGFNEIVRTGE